MNERERFHRLANGSPVDRPPLLEEGVREEVLARWHEQGLAQDSTHLEVFGLAPHERVGPDITYVPGYFGRVFDLSSRDYGRAFHVSRRRFPPDWSKTVERLEHRDHIVCVWASRGFFQALGVGDWPTFERALVATIKEPARVRSRLEQYGEFCARMLELTLQDIEPEFIYLSEPISNNDGPLISPGMFREFMLHVYRRIIATAKEHGCTNILVSTYGNTALLFPPMLDAGVTMLWISEAAEVPELDYRALRCLFGPSLGLIGGIPLSLLRTNSTENMKNRLAEIVTPLLRSGRYIPLAGGRVREETPWLTYKSYREALAELMRMSLLANADHPGPVDANVKPAR